jgi:hypothetical protein
MTTILLAWLLAHGVPGPHAEALAPCIAESEDPFVMLGVMHVESRYRSGPRSKAGACSYFGLLGGRYGNPPCEVLEAHPGVACQKAVEELRYWKRHCGEAYLDAYNGGWAKCWAGKHREQAKCRAEGCRRYGDRVRRHAEWARLVLDALR